MLPDNDEDLIESVKSKVREVQYCAMVKVNGMIFRLQWNIGKELNEQVQYVNTIVTSRLLVKLLVFSLREWYNYVQKEACHE